MHFNKYIFRQCLLSLGMTLDFFMAGATLSFSATLLPQLQSNASTIVITDQEATWIASIELLGGGLGPLISCILVEIFGQKWTYTFVAFANFTSWMVIGWSTQVWQILVGRTIQGIANGISNPICTCLIGEVTLQKYRSLMLNFVNIGMTVGMLFADAMGTYFTWRISAYVFAGMALSSFVIFCNMRNTYVWYLSRNRVAEARNAFIWYQGTDCATLNEFEAQVADTLNTHFTIKHLANQLMHREFLLPVLIICWFQTTVLFTGSYGELLYSIDIMKTVVTIDGYLTTLIIDVLRIISCIVTGILITFLPIRLITNVSSILGVFYMLVLCTSKYWESTVMELKWISLVSILFFNFIDTIGHSNICNIVSGELFTGTTKTFGMAFSSMYFFGVYFLTAQFIPIMFMNLGPIWSFAIFSLFNIIGSIGIYFILPETQNLNNSEIRACFKDQNYSKTILNRLCFN